MSFSLMFIHKSLIKHAYPAGTAIASTNTELENNETSLFIENIYCCLLAIMKEKPGGNSHPYSRQTVSSNSNHLHS